MAAANKKPDMPKRLLRILVACLLLCFIGYKVWKIFGPQPEDAPGYIEETVLPELRKNVALENEIEAAGRGKEPEKKPRLRYDVRSRTYFLLSRLNIRADADGDMASIIRELENSNDPRMQRYLMVVIELTTADIGPAIPVLANLVERSNDLAIRGRALNLIVEKGKPEAVLPILQFLVGNPASDGELIKVAVREIGKFGPAAASSFPALYDRMLNAENVDLAIVAASALSAIGLPEGKDKELFADLAATRTSAARAGLAALIQKRGLPLNAAETEVLARALADEPNEIVRTFIIAALGDNTNAKGELVQELANILKNATDWATVASASSALDKLDLMKEPVILDGYRVAMRLLPDRRGQDVEPVFSALMRAGNPDAQWIAIDSYLKCSSLMNFPDRICDRVAYTIQKGVPFRPETVKRMLEEYHSNGYSRERIEILLVFAGEDSLPVIDEAIRRETNAALRARLTSYRAQIPKREAEMLAVKAREQREKNL